MLGFEHPAFQVHLNFKHDAHMKASLGHTRTRDVTPSLSPMAHDGPLLPRGVPVTHPALHFYPVPLGTLPVSE